MGRALRWLKGLFGIKAKQESSDGCMSGYGLIHNPTTIPPNISPTEAAWLSTFYVAVNKQRQAKNGVAMPAGDADAAIAAVVKLTCHVGGSGLDERRERDAAIMIQAYFRGYLARKALRALKGLVKLQAHVRGFLVRKQANAAFYSIQALIRAQATVMSHRGCNRSNPVMDSRKSTDLLKINRHGREASSLSNKMLILMDFEDSRKIVKADCPPCKRSSSPIPAPAFPESRSFEMRSDRSEHPNTGDMGHRRTSRLRSISAPKQRGQISLGELIDSRKSLRRDRMQRSSNQEHEIIKIKKAAVI